MSDRKVPTARLGTRLLGLYKARYFLNAVMWTAMWVMPVLTALITKQFFDRITGETQAGFDVATLVMLMVAYGVGRIASLLFAMWNDQHHGFRLASVMRRNMLEGIFELPGARALRESPGEAISRFRDDVDEVTESLSWTADLVGIAVFSTVAVWILLSIDARVTLLVFGPTVAVVWIAAGARRRIKRYREAAREATGHITEALGETFGAVQSIKVSGAERSMIGHFRHLNDARRVVMVKDKVLTSVLESIFWNTLSVGTGLILIVAASGIRSGEFTVGEFSVFVYFLGFVTDAVFFLGLFIARYQQAEVSFRRMIELMGEGDPMRLVQPAKLDLTGPLPKPEVVPPRFTPLQELRVEGLTHHYPGARTGIEDVSFALRRGSFTVVTGRVGAGKTTLLRTLLGLLPAERGRVLWNGEVVRDPARFFIPPRSAYTPQVPRLFSMSLVDNLLMGRRDPEPQVREAIASAVMDSDLEHMPEGLATMVGPLGVRLSGGQIQRSATARMFVRRPDLLVFDDVSSALDVETERTLWERLFTERAEVTSLVVSHRRPALRRADLIIVMSEGRVAATGTLDQLMGVPEFQAIWEGNSD